MERDEAIRVIESNWPNGRIMICEALTVAIADIRAAQAQATAAETVGMVKCLCEWLDDDGWSCTNNPSCPIHGDEALA